MLKRTHYLGGLSKDMAGQEVILSGWIEDIRDLGGLKFFIMKDKTGRCQVTAPKGRVDAKVIAALDELPAWSCVTVKGKLKEFAKAPGGFELSPAEVQVDSRSEPELPIDDKSSLPKRLDWRFLDLRQDKNNLVFRIWTEAENLMRQYFIKENFIQMHSPKMTGIPSEGGAEVFSLKYFDKKAYLVQSPQLYKQMAMAAGYDKVFEIGPAFRAEPSHTIRHQTEFTSVDVEFSWVESHEDVMAFEEKWLTFVFKGIKDKFGDEIKKHFGVDVVVPKVPFPRVTMKEAIAMVGDTKEMVSKDGDLGTAGEKKFGELVSKKFNHEFVFLTEFPYSARPFYHMKLEAGSDLTRSFDLVYKGMEVTTGAQREHRHDVLADQAKEKGVDDVGGYLDYFRFGMPPHGGFGFGLARLIMLMLGVENVREVSFLSRDTERLFP